MDKITRWKLNKVPISTFLAKVAKCSVYATFFADRLLFCPIFFTLPPDSCQHLSLTFTVGNTYESSLGWRLSVSYTLHRCLHGNKMDKVCLSDGQQQLERASGLMHSLRLELWVQPESCTAEGSKDPERWGGTQSKRPQRRELLSGCQTSRLSFIIN